MKTLAQEPLYTVEEAAEYLRVSRDTVRGWIRKGALRAHRLGPAGLIRIPKPALEEFLDTDLGQNRTV